MRGFHARSVFSGSARTASAGRDRQRSRNVLVVAQVAMALVLLVSALLMIRTFAALRNVEPGFTDPAACADDAHRDSGAAGAGSSSRDAYAEQHRGQACAHSGRLCRRVRRGGADGGHRIRTGTGFASRERTMRAASPRCGCSITSSPGYLSAMGTLIVAGRDFTWSDLYGLRPMVMVSENFARETWGSATAAIGKRVRQFTDKPWQEVIGVVQDVREHGVDREGSRHDLLARNAERSVRSQVCHHRPNYVTFAIRSDAQGRRAFFGDAAGGLVGEPQPAAGVGAGRCRRSTRSRWRGRRSRW